MTPSYIINVSIINILWTIANGRRLHNFQQEFQSVYECIEKITGFMSRAAIMSFMPFLARVLPESITRMERGRYFRDRFVAISEVYYLFKKAVIIVFQIVHKSLKYFTIFMTEMD